MPTLWITGVSGFTGRHLVAFVRTLADPPRIIGLDLTRAAEPDADEVHAVDLVDAAAIHALAAQARPDWVIHLAGLMPPSPEGEMWRANVGGTLGLLVGLRAAGCNRTRVVSIGSAAEYSSDAQSPLTESSATGGASTYGNSKLAQTLTGLQYATEGGLDLVVARTFNLIGPGLPARLVAGALVSQFAQADPDAVIRVGNTHTARDFVDVRDAVRAYWLLARSGERGVFNVCSGRAASVGDLLQALTRISGRAPRIETEPSRVRATDPIAVFGNPTRLQQTTGWRPEIDLERSLRDMLVAA